MSRQFRTFTLHFAPSGPELPKRLLVAKWGVNKSANGDYIVNETTARELPANLRRTNFNTTDLDFEHNTVPGSPAYKASGEPRKRAAEGRLEVVPGEGVYLHATQWTPEGADAVNGRHYSDLSPAILTNKAGEVIFIHSVALARQGATEDLPLDLHASDPLNTLFTTHSTMDQYKKILLALLGLSDSATDDQIHSSALKLGEKLDAAGKQGDTIKTMSANYDALLKRVDDNERASLIRDAIKAGKLVPHSANTLDLAAVRTLLSELPADVVPMDRRTPEGVKLHSSNAMTSAEEANADEVCRQLGLKKDDFKKFAA